MLSGTQKKTLDALFRALQPIARALLRTGIGYREFAEVAKSAFVSVASADYGIRGRPTNTSRVAVMTGLTRKEVKRLREIKSSGKRFEVQKAIAPASVLGNWFSDREFTDEDGKPRVLDFNGGKGTFTDLVKRFGGDVPAGAMRTELLRVGAIEELEGKKLKVLKSAFTPSNLDDRLAVALQLSLRRLGETILYNTDAKNREELRVERTIMTVPIMRDDLPSLRRVSAERLVEFANSMQDFFSDFEATHPTTEAEESLSVGVGIFYFEDSPDSSRL